LRYRRFLLLLPMLLAGCATGPAYERPQVVDMPLAFSAADTTVILPDTRPQYDWWKVFGSSELNDLVEEALVASPDLAAAAAQVLEAEAGVKGARSNLLPTVSIGGTGTRAKQSLAAMGGFGSIYRTSYSASAQAAYELDLWGRLSSTRKSAWATLLAGEAQQRAVRQSLIANVISGWLTTREATQQYELAVDTEDSYRRNLEMVEDRYRNGVVTASDLHLARQNVASAQARTQQSQQDMLGARYRLEILVGRFPAGEIGARGDDLSQLPEPAPVPAGLPADILKRRPDLMAAEMQLVGANAAISIAKADLFPKLTLTGSDGYTSSTLENLFKDASSIWSLAANLSMPLLNRGAVKSQVKAAEARTQQAQAAYVKAVLAGFQDVQVALTGDRQQGLRRGFLRESALHANRSLTIAQENYSQGLTPYLTVLEAQRRYFQAQSDLLRAERLRREARINLILALGGDWDQVPAVDEK
jgi:outer membrane protein, multidrug efflux system